MLPETLYKYLPTRYVEAVMKEGSLLFRNLAYFRKVEDNIRGDELEGSHLDMPEDGFTLTFQNGRKLRGEKFANSIDPEGVFAFCLSTTLNQRLFDEFESDVCIKIVNVRKFLTRCKRKVDWIPGSSEFACGMVEYYEFGRKTARSIKDPVNIPLFKPSDYSNQSEYRIYFAMEDSLKMTKKITIKGNPLGLPEETSEKSIPKSLEKIIRIGSLDDVASVVRRESM